MTGLNSVAAMMSQSAIVMLPKVTPPSFDG
jgi:hypothetical protein